MEVRTTTRLQHTVYFEDVQCAMVSMVLSLLGVRVGVGVCVRCVCRVRVLAERPLPSTHAPARPPARLSAQSLCMHAHALQRQLLWGSTHLVWSVQLGSSIQ